VNVDDVEKTMEAKKKRNLCDKKRCRVPCKPTIRPVFNKNISAGGASCLEGIAKRANTRVAVREKTVSTLPRMTEISKTTGNVSKEDQAAAQRLGWGEEGGRDDDLSNI